MERLNIVSGEQNQLNKVKNRGGRIQYLDALRGFTMLLVVMTHVSTFCLGLIGTDTFSYSKIFGEFRMPLFFFVSGFVLYKSGFEWSFNNTITFLKKKLTVQILSPFLFLLVFAHLNDVDLQKALFDYQKNGYWFTFTLFQYFCFYILIQWTLKLIRLQGIFKDYYIIAIGLIFYILTVYSFVVKYNLNEGVYGLLGIPTWHYFLFFLLGTRIRKYFSQFESLLDSNYFTLIVAGLFFGLNIYSELSCMSSTLYNLLLSVSGLILIFAMFRKYQSYFNSEKRIGQIAQFVGRRTLDIYLLHYFFIFSNMSAMLPNFSLYKSPFIEFMCSLGMAILILSACLLISSVLRLNPLLAHFLFGQKLSQNK